MYKKIFCETKTNRYLWKSAIIFDLYSGTSLGWLKMNSAGNVKLQYKIFYLIYLISFVREKFWNLFLMLMIIHDEDKNFMGLKIVWGGCMHRKICESLDEWIPMPLFVGHPWLVLVLETFCLPSIPVNHI